MEEVLTQYFVALVPSTDRDRVARGWNCLDQLSMQGVVGRPSLNAGHRMEGKLVSPFLALVEVFEVYVILPFATCTCLIMPLAKR